MRTTPDVILSMQRYVAQALPEPWEVRVTLEAGDVPDRPFAVVSADGGEDELATLLAAPMPRLPVTVQAYVAADTVRGAIEAGWATREALWQLVHVGAGEGREMLLPLYDYDGRPTVQEITVEGRGGTWLLGWRDGATVTWSDPLRYDAQPAEVRDAVAGLSGFDARAIEVHGRIGGPWAVRFVGEQLGRAVAVMEADESGLEGPHASATVAILQTGSPEPWRRPQDFARISQATFSDLPDATDPKLRTVTLGCRLTWQRKGRLPSAEMILRSIGTTFD